MNGAGNDAAQALTDVRADRNDMRLIGPAPCLDPLPDPRAHLGQRFTRDQHVAVNESVNREDPRYAQPFYHESIDVMGVYEVGAKFAQIVLHLPTSGADGIGQHATTGLTQAMDTNTG